MSLITWDACLCIGYEPVDEQHMHLVALINQLQYATTLGWGQQIVSYVFDELVDYTQSHFATEECLMKYHVYPAGVHHRQERDELTRQVFELRSQLAAGRPVVTAKVLEFLTAWLTDHILGADMALGSFLAGRPGVRQNSPRAEHVLTPRALATLAPSLNDALAIWPASPSAAEPAISLGTVHDCRRA